MEGNWIFVDFYLKSIPIHKSGHDASVTIPITSSHSEFILYINRYQPMNKLLEMKPKWSKRRLILRVHPERAKTHL